MVKIIGAGLCRTGTTSTVVALDSLGFGPVYHYNEVSFRPEKVQGRYQGRVEELFLFQSG